jgi:hypothetical protein
MEVGVADAGGPYLDEGFIGSRLWDLHLHDAEGTFLDPGCSHLDPPLLSRLSLGFAIDVGGTS